MPSLSLQQEKHRASQETEPSDGTLVEQSLAGDEYAFETLVRRYRLPLLNYIRNILKDDDQAHDVLQFVLLRLYLSRPTLLKDMPLKAWLFQVAYHRSLDVLRQQRRRPAIHFSELYGEDENEGGGIIEAIPDPRPLPEEIVEQHDLNEVLQLAIQSLSPKLRGVVHLRCFGSLTFSEIGQALKMPEATAKTYFYRALPRLRTMLQNNTTISLSF